MLNPTQLKLHNFQLLENGCYSPREVDNFFRTVTEDYSSMFSENGDLVRKLGILAAKLEEYRKDESVLRDVLMNAQKNAELLIASAQQRANEMIEDANSQVQRIMKDGESIIDTANDKAHKISIAAEAEYESLIASAKVLADSYIATANEKCEEIQMQTRIAVEKMLTDVQEQSTQVLEQAATEAQAIKDEAAMSIEEYVEQLRENARAEIEEKAVAARLLFDRAQAEADRITAEAAQEADELLQSVKEQSESLLSVAMAKKETIEISSNAKAQLLIDESRQKADELLSKSRATAEALIKEAQQLANDAAKQYDMQMQEAARQAQELLDDGRGKAVAMLTEAKEVTSDAKQRSDASSQQILARIKEQALKMLTDAKTYSDEVCEKVLLQAEQVVSAAKIEADRILSEAKEYAEKTKQEITELSDARLSRAMDMSDSLITSAQADAQKIIATAQTRVSVAFDDVEGKVEQTLQDAERKRVELLETAKAQAEETTKAADENAQRMMDEAIEKASDMLLGAKQENERITALTEDMKQQLADSIAMAQSEYDTLREKAMELRKKMLAQLLTEDEQKNETARRSVRDIPEFDPQSMLREGMKRAKESAAEIVKDSKEILQENGLYEERTELPVSVADIEENSLADLVEDVQHRIDIDNTFEEPATKTAEISELPEIEINSEIEDRIITNAAIDVATVVDTLVGEEGFAKVDDSIVTEGEKFENFEFDELPDFDSMIDAYNAVSLSNNPFAKTDEEADDTNDTIVVETAPVDDEAVEATSAETDIPVTELDFVAIEDTEITVNDESFEAEPQNDEDVASMSEENKVSFDSFETLDDAILFAGETIPNIPEPVDDYKADDNSGIVLIDESIALPVTAVAPSTKPDVEPVVSQVAEAVVAQVAEPVKTFDPNDGDWSSFGDFEDIGDEGFESLDDMNDDFADFSSENEDMVEYIAPIHEDYVQEDAVFTDYDDSMRSFEDISDAPESKPAQPADDDDLGFEIDFSVFEDSPKRPSPVFQEKPAEKPAKGGFFSRIKRK